MSVSSLALRVIQNRSGGVPKPSWCTYLVSYRCNARCGMCDSWRMKPGREMTPAEAEAAFEKIGRLDVVRISGGEPFLREDLLPIAEGVMRASRPIVLHITTNGSFPERVRDFVARFSRPRRLAFLVSVDGMPEEHDKSRGKDVTFASVVETVSLLVSLGIKTTVNHTVISGRSIEDHEAIKATFAPLGVDVSSVLAYAESSMYGLKLRGKRATHLIVPKGYPLHPNLVGADTIGFVERELAAVSAVRHPTERVGKRYYLRGLLARLKGDELARPHPRCVALRSHVRLLPDGRVPVCQFNTETVGDLRAETFEAVWHGDGAREARAWVDACPGCWAECEVMPSAIYTGDILRGVA